MKIIIHPMFSLCLGITDGSVLPSMQSMVRISTISPRSSYLSRPTEMKAFAPKRISTIIVEAYIATICAKRYVGGTASTIQTAMILNLVMIGQKRTMKYGTFSGSKSDVRQPYFSFMSSLSRSSFLQISTHVTRTRSSKHRTIKMMEAIMLASSPSSFRSLQSLKLIKAPTKRISKAPSKNAIILFQKVFLSSLFPFCLHLPQQNTAIKADSSIQATEIMITIFMLPNIKIKCGESIAIQEKFGSLISLSSRCVYFYVYDSMSIGSNVRIPIKNSNITEAFAAIVTFIITR